MTTEEALAIIRLTDPPSWRLLETAEDRNGSVD